MDPKLQSLTIKPSAQCSSACPYCSDRRHLLARHRVPSLTLGDWKRIIHDAIDLGTKRIDISGGEPTLYPDLLDLVALCKQYAQTSINSNGSNLSEDKIIKLTEMGLDNMSISLMSLLAEKHDRIRNSTGSYCRMLDAFQTCSRHRVPTTLHFILCKHNYQELPDIILFASAVKAKAIVLAYPENDHNRRYLLMNREQINDFRCNVLPRAKDSFAKAFGYSIDQELENLFLEPSGTDYSIGLYNTETVSCQIPSSFALVYPDGTVLPCNGVEYFHSPTVGDLRRKSLIETWSNEQFSEFRHSKSSFCHLCPMRQMFYHRVIPQGEQIRRANLITQRTHWNEILHTKVNHGENSQQ